VTLSTPAFRSANFIAWRSSRLKLPSPTNRSRNPGGTAAVNLREIAGHPREQQPRGRMECDRQHSRNRHGKSLGEWSDSRTEPASQDYVTVKFM
jgi:hypothetical protein